MGKTGGWIISNSLTHKFRVWQAVNWGNRGNKMSHVIQQPAKNSSYGRTGPRAAREGQLQGTSTFQDCLYDVCYFTIGQNNPHSETQRQCEGLPNNFDKERHEQIRSHYLIIHHNLFGSLNNFMSLPHTKQTPSRTPQMSHLIMALGSRSSIL